MTNPTPTDVNTLIERLESHDIFGDGPAFYAADVPKAEQLLDEAAQALRAMQARVGALEEALAPFANPPLYAFDGDEIFVPAPRPEDWIGGGWFSSEDFRRAWITQQEAQRHGE